jgi:hypothetical protein
LVPNAYRSSVEKCDDVASRAQHFLCVAKDLPTLRQQLSEAANEQRNRAEAILERIIHFLTERQISYIIPCRVERSHCRRAECRRGNADEDE